MTGDFFAPRGVIVGEGEPTAFCAANGTYQDGTTPMYRDVDGTLWAMSGHSHMGSIGVYRGKSLDDMKKSCDIALNFRTGSAEFAFSGIRYPEGILPRGSVWPFGLYICPVTHRFFCLFHNETGWNGTSEYDPGRGVAKGPDRGVISLGSGDFSVYVCHGDGFIYLFYNIIRFDMDRAEWKSCDVYAARSRIRTDGVFGDFVKYYGGAFREAGNLGMESALASNSWHPRIARLKKYSLWCMVSVLVTPGERKTVSDRALIRFSKDLTSWSEPTVAEYNGGIFGNHYVAMVSDSDSSQPFDIDGDAFSFLANHNGKDVIRYRSRFISDR